MPWTAEELEFLTEHARCCSSEVIARALGRSRRAVHQRAAKLGLGYLLLPGVEPLRPHETGEGRLRIGAVAVSKPRILDLFCGAGGAAVGYHRAGFEVVGVDIKPQPHYPFEFHQADALEWLDAMPFDFPNAYQAIHASPPCQGYSRMRFLPWLRDRDYPLLIEPTREMLRKVGVPWIIENVEDAPLQFAPGLFGEHGLTLCGTMFDLPGQYRHRRFESNVAMVEPYHPRHTFVMAPGSASLAKRYPGRVVGVSAWQEAGGVARRMGNRARAERSMGIDWMSVDELREAIPPAMTEFLGSQLLEHLNRAEADA